MQGTSLWHPMHLAWQLEATAHPMRTVRLFGCIKGCQTWNARPRPSSSYSLQGTVCLEERLLLSGTASQPIFSAHQVEVATALRPAEAGAFTKRKLNETVFRNITYTDAFGRPEALDIYVPKGLPPTGGWPVILAIHGGGWRKQDKRDYGPRIAGAFVPNGYVVVAPDYPLSSPGNPTWPINLEDLQTAVRWIKANASTFNIDTGRIVAMGESAGANLAELLGTGSPSTANSGSAETAAIAAVVSFSGPSDLTALYESNPLAGAAVAQLLGGPPAALPASYMAASPVDQVAQGDPPTFLVHGANDPLVPVSQSEEMAAALTSARVRNELVVLPGAGHELDFPIKTPRNLVFQILEFLDTTWNYRGSIP